MFMTYVNLQINSNEVWFADSACSNHVINDKSKFKDLDETHKSWERLWDNKQVKTEEKGTIAVKVNEQVTMRVAVGP